MTPTLDQIRQKGLAALQRELGQAGMVRFLQQFENGSGNYAIERHEWVDRSSLEELRSLAKLKRTRAKKRQGRA